MVLPGVVHEKTSFLRRCRLPLFPFFCVCPGWFYSAWFYSAWFYSA
jgi:hypothetical protein